MASRWYAMHRPKIGKIRWYLKVYQSRAKWLGKTWMRRTFLLGRSKQLNHSGVSQNTTKLSHQSRTNALTWSSYSSMVRIMEVSGLARGVSVQKARCACALAPPSHISQKRVQKLKRAPEKTACIWFHPLDSMGKLHVAREVVLEYIDEEEESSMCLCFGSNWWSKPRKAYGVLRRGWYQARFTSLLKTRNREASFAMVLPPPATNYEPLWYQTILQGRGWCDNRCAVAVKCLCLLISKIDLL